MNYLKPLTIVPIGANNSYKPGERRNCDDEFNKHMSLINAILVDHINSSSIKEFHFHLQRLLTNEYFRFMYASNQVSHAYIYCDPINVRLDYSSFILDRTRVHPQVVRCHFRALVRLTFESRNLRLVSFSSRMGH